MCVHVNVCVLLLDEMGRLRKWRWVGLATRKSEVERMRRTCVCTSMQAYERGGWVVVWR